MSGSVQLDNGKVIGGDFRVIEPLKHGGMGSVYVVEQVQTGARRALKLMHPQLVQDPKFRKRFEQEARIGALIPSEHVVQVIAAGVDSASGTAWLVMELLEGEDLDSTLRRRGQLPQAEATEVLGQLCHALAAAHSVGIVHRDLKPANIYLAVARRRGVPFTVKVLDFGIAKIVAEASTAATEAVGSPMWMAPEQTTQDHEILPATDVWALGLLTFRLLTGRYYWKAPNKPGATTAMLFREILIEPLPSAAQRAAEHGVAGLPKGFDSWFGKCVAREPAARFKNAGEAFTMLEKILVAPKQQSAPAPALDMLVWKDSKDPAKAKRTPGEDSGAVRSPQRLSDSGARKTPSTKADVLAPVVDVSPARESKPSVRTEMERKSDATSQVPFHALDDAIQRASKPGADEIDVRASTPPSLAGAMSAAPDTVPGRVSGSFAALITDEADDDEPTKEKAPPPRKRKLPSAHLPDSDPSSEDKAAEAATVVIAKPAGPPVIRIGEPPPPPPETFGEPAKAKIAEPVSARSAAPVSAKPIDGSKPAEPQRTKSGEYAFKLSSQRSPASKPTDAREAARATLDQAKQAAKAKLAEVKDAAKGKAGEQAPKSFGSRDPSESSPPDEMPSSLIVMPMERQSRPPPSVKAPVLKPEEPAKAKPADAPAKQTPTKAPEIEPAAEAEVAKAKPPEPPPKAQETKKDDIPAPRVSPGVTPLAVAAPTNFVEEAPNPPAKPEKKATPSEPDAGAGEAESGVVNTRSDIDDIKRPPERRLGRIGAVAALGLVVILLAVMGIRSYQQGQVERVCESESAAKEGGGSRLDACNNLCESGSAIHCIAKADLLLHPAPGSPVNREGAIAAYQAACKLGFDPGCARANELTAGASPSSTPLGGTATTATTAAPIDIDAATAPLKHIVIMFSRSLGAPATVTRTKEQAQARAQEALNKARAGAKFEDLVREYTDDEPSKDRGGAPDEQMMSRLVTMGESMKAGDIIMVPTPVGYHVLLRTTFPFYVPASPNGRRTPDSGSGTDPVPSGQPSTQPSGTASTQPSGQPNTQPSGQPSTTPSTQPSGQPSAQPSGQPTTPTGPLDENAMKKALEPRVYNGSASLEDMRMLRAICIHLGDMQCKAKATAAIAQKQAEQQPPP